jgi:vacuolar-type H+-ATPase subunit H
MKKVLFAVTIIVALGFSAISCKSEAKKETEENKTEVVKEEMAKATYQCPMKCEGDKTYDAPGQCPVCKMDLKEVEGKVKRHLKEADSDVNNHIKEADGKIKNHLKEAGNDVKKDYKKVDGDVKKELKKVDDGVKKDYEKVKSDVKKKKN